MSVPQRQVLERIRVHTQEIEARYPEYRNDLIKALADIMSIQKAKPSDHINKVEQRATQLGDLISSHESV
jgi:hypothetical protein